MNSPIINLHAGILSHADLEESTAIVPWYSDAPVRECRHCLVKPTAGYFAGYNCYQIRCVNWRCPVKPWVTGQDENIVRGVWLGRYAVRAECYEIRCACGARETFDATIVECYREINRLGWGLIPTQHNEVMSGVCPACRAGEIVDGKRSPERVMEEILRGENL